MKAGRDYPWWVSYSWECEIFYDGQWNAESSFDEGRFACRKKDLKNAVTEHIKEDELNGDFYRNLKVTISDSYITTPTEI